MRWALSATYLPRITILSHKGASAYFAANLAALNLATFSVGVSANVGGEEEEGLSEGFWDGSAFFLERGERKLGGKGCEEEDDAEDAEAEEDRMANGLE